MGKSLLDKVWDLHRVAELPSGETQLFVGLHLVHEVTSPQAFAMLRERGLAVRHPELTVATVDHIVPTDDVQRPFADPMAEQMLQHLERNVAEHGIRYYGLGHAEQGIVHVIGPQLGLTQPGMTIACGDSHTSTHGAFGAIAFGIGTSQVRDVLATQTLAMRKPKLRRITVEGDLGPGVYAKDVILSIIATLGVKGGIGYAYEYAGSTIDALDMEGRMSICNMSIEGGARVGYVNPDQTTFDFLRGRPEAPAGGGWERAVEFWRGMASDPDTGYDDEVVLKAADIEPVVTWGTNPGQSAAVTDMIPDPERASDELRDGMAAALGHMKLQPGRAAGRHADRRRFHRLLHEQPADRPARSGAGGGGPARLLRRQGAGGARIAPHRRSGRLRGIARGVRGGRVRVARRRLLDVPGDEPGQAGRGRRSRPPRRTATSSAGRGRRTGARC